MHYLQKSYFSLYFYIGFESLVLWTKFDLIAPQTLLRIADHVWRSMGTVSSFRSSHQLAGPEQISACHALYDIHAH